MKKLYVLVFLIMFMGKIFSSTTIQESSQEEETFTVPSIAYYDNSNQYIHKKNGDVVITLPSNAYETITSGGGKTGGGMGGSSREEPITEDVKLKPKIYDAIRAKLEFYKKSFYELNEFFKASSIEMPTLTLSDLKGNPWDTVAPKAFAEGTGITESDLKPSLFRNFGKTPEQKFILNLQRKLIEKIISESTKPENITKLLEILVLSNSRLPVGIGKTTVELLDSLNLSSLQRSGDKRVAFDKFRTAFLLKEAAKAAVAKAENILLEASIVAGNAEKAAKEATKEAITKKAAKEREQKEADRSAEAKKQRGKVITDNRLNQVYNQTDDVNDKSKQEALAKAIAEHEAAQQAKIRADSAHEVAQEALTKAKGEHDAALQRLREAQQREVESPR